MVTGVSARGFRSLTLMELDLTERYNVDMNDTRKFEHTCRLQRYYKNKINDGLSIYA